MTLPEPYKILLATGNTHDRKALSASLTDAQLPFEIDHAESGPTALENLSDHYYDCAVIDTNLPGGSGVGVLRQLRDQGYVRAQYNLGKLYRDGHGGLEQSYTEAVSWFRKAALQGYAKAQDHLATRYARSEGVGQDDVTALAWLNLAAKQGFTTALENRKALLRRMSESEIADAKRLTEDLRRQIGG